MAFERQIHSADSLVSKIVKGHCEQMGEETEEWYAPRPRDIKPLLAAEPANNTATCLSGLSLANSPLR